jgi:CubicO group peptidase (beta-lactamase class C family)
LFHLKLAHGVNYFFYGYGWWLERMAGHTTYAAIGTGGQYIIVVPDLDIVVVSMSQGVGSDVDMLAFTRYVIIPAAEE